MITELTIEDPSRTPCSWWPDIEAYKKTFKFEFNRKGLTVILGPNGSGKSSLLKILARLTHCEQGGIPKVTRTSVDYFFERLNDRDDMRAGASIKTDGKPVHYLDPGSSPGLVGGHFDDDFFNDGVASTFAKKTSSGQQITAGINRILKSAATCSKVEWGIRRDSVNSFWEKRIDATTKFLESNIDQDGPPTILLDEPTRSLSISREIETWELLAKQERFQIIAATHSVFALNLPGTTYIDVVPGYLAECREAFEKFQKTHQIVSRTKR